MRHFEYYPKVEYSNNTAVNIMVRGKLRDAVLSNSALYYKYTISDDMSAEIISSKYYDDPNKVWAIYYANNIFDPVREWPMTQKQFERYLTSKYGSVHRAATKFNTDGTICWDSIHHFVHTDPNTKIEYVIDKKTFIESLNLTHIFHSTTRSVTFYEHEMMLNNQKRNIIVLDKKNLNQIVSEIRNLF